MISLDLEQASLLGLIKKSLFDLRPTISNEVNWDKLFEIAKSQAVVPLIASYVPSDYREEWLKISCQCRARLMQLLYETDSIFTLFKKNDISFLVLKGTSAAIYYPNPSLRTFGDIDLFVSDKQIDFIRELIEHNGFHFVLNTDRHFTYSKNGIEFEFHTSFSCKHYNNIDNILLMSLNNAVDYKIGNFAFPGLSTYENGLILLGHIMQHLHDMGIGFRQIIDWMMFVHNRLDDYAWQNYFRPLAAEAGLEKLAITVTFMCRKWFGLPDEITWCDNADNELVDQLLLRLFYDGNFGSGRASFENINKAMKEEGVFAYLQHAGLENWNLARKHAFFRPFAWIYQAFRFAYKGVWGMIFGKKVFRKDKSNMSLKDFLDRLDQPV